MKAIKKIVALGIGATMMGATILGAAAAADLATYPAPFITSGKFSGVLVVGDQAAAEDIIGISDIAMSLQYSATTSAGTTNIGAVSVSGDAWKVGTSSKKLEMTNNEGTGAIGNETFRDIMTAIDEDELKALADGSITTEKGTAGYNQYINFDDSARNGGFIMFTENDDDVAGDFLYFRSGRQIARYSLEFKTSLQSDIEDSTGTKTTTGTYLGDMEDEPISILGKPYSIVKARRTSSTGSSAELTLMGGAVKDVLNEGETKTYTIGGKDYETTCTAITDTGTIYAKFNINGETTKSLKDGDSATLSDGTEIGISDIIPNEAGDVTQDQVEFYLGASKIYLKDTKIQDTWQTASSLEVGSEKIDDAYVIITGSDDNSTFSIDTIQMNITADDDYFVVAGHSLTEYMEEPQAFLGLWDIKYEGLDPSIEVETAKVKTSGSDVYKIEFADGDGKQVDVPIAYAGVASNITRVGDNDDDLVLQESVAINKNDYLIVWDGSQTDGNRKTYALRYKGANKVASGETASVKFDNLGTGNRIEQTYTTGTGNGTATLKLGGATYTVVNKSAETVNDFDVWVDLDGNAAFGSNVIGINTNSGMKINLTDNATAQTAGVSVRTQQVSFSTPDANDYDNIMPASVILNLTADSSRKVQFADDGSTTIGWVSPSAETNIRYAYTSMGAKFKWNNPTSDPDLLDVEYPKEQRLPLAYITTPGVSITTATAETAESVVVNKIEVGATKLASEVSNIKAQNAILVGGPCANNAAAEIKGNPADCAAGYEAGTGLLELFENDGNVALLIAGYTAADTRNAATVIANSADYTLAGTRMAVTKTTAGTIEVAEAAAPVVAEEEAPATV